MIYRFFMRPAFCVVMLTTAASMWALPASAIVVNHVDNFNDGTTQNWQISTPDIFPVNQPNSGPSGAGDSSLWMATDGAGGSDPHLLVFNTSSNWTGSWTAAGVARIQLDVLAPSTNNFGLQMRLGIAGPLPPGEGDTGNTWVTPATAVPSDNQWHRITFDVLAANFIADNGTNVNSALASVAHFRILHNPETSFSGADTSFGGGEFFLDNITALAALSTPTVNGDYNHNGVVDAADYVLWRNTLGQSVAVPGNGADGNQSGSIDAGDYAFWRSHFGNLVTGAGLGPETAIGVPEPTSLCLLVLCLSALRFDRGQKFKTFAH